LTKKAPLTSEASLQDEAFLADVKAGARHDGRFRLWWLGQSGFLLAWKDSFALLDPYLSDSLTKKYADTDKPHVRITARVVDPSALDFIDVTTSSHSHTDHQDPETLRALLRANPEMTLVVPAATVGLCSERIGVPMNRLTSIDEGLTIEVGPFVITGVAAAHEKLEYDEKGACEYLGYLLRFGGWTIYHAGDTVDYPGLAEKLRGCGVDVALLPINGRGKGVPGNLNAMEAVQLARRMGARLAVPCHYEMFEFSTADPAEFREAAAACGQPAAILAVGGRYESFTR
jgi:L-ascorbate metabolism protein UlaG (beta-lactamase superfamily)